MLRLISFLAFVGGGEFFSTDTTAVRTPTVEDGNTDILASAGHDHVTSAPSGYTTGAACDVSNCDVMRKLEDIERKIDSINQCNNNVCPSNFEKIGNLCYYLNVDQADWYSSSRRCQQLHARAHLVVIGNSQENMEAVNFITKKISNSSFCGDMGVWTAGQRIDPTSQSDFVWKPRSDSWRPLTYTNYVSGQPDYGCHREACLHVSLGQSTRGQWNDVACAGAPCGPSTCSTTELCSLCQIDL